MRFYEFMPEGAVTTIDPKEPLPIDVWIDMKNNNLTQVEIRSMYPKDKILETVCIDGSKYRLQWTSKPMQGLRPGFYVYDDHRQGPHTPRLAVRVTMFRNPLYSESEQELQ